jgi:glutathione transport system substrate-binding protein
MSNNYWDKVLDRRITRRRGMALAGGSAAAAAFLAACGSDGDDGGDSGTTDGGGTTTDPGTPTVGGKLIWQGYGDPGAGLELIKSSNNGVLQMSSLTHDALLDFAYGQPKYPGIGNEVLPSLAAALPEISPDKLTITFKLKPAKFHNGRDLTSEDVKWTFDTLAKAPESAYKNAFAWLESFTAPDKSTIVLKAKSPNADALESLAFKAGSGVGILAREHHESGASEKSLMGSGPYTFVEYNPPLVMSYKRNPNYITDTGKPYFDAIDRLGTSDSEKKVADIIAKQVHVTYWFPAEERERIKAQRKDINLFQYPRAGAGNIYFRNDVAPFSDKRVRQALSMGYDRTLLINSVAAGEGQADQALSRSGSAWEFRGPEALPRKDLYLLNVAEAKKLLAAAGVTLPMKFDLPTWNSTVIGQKFVDEITSITTQWRNNGIADAKLLEETFGQFSPRSTGIYDSVQWGPNTNSTVPNVGLSVKDKYWSPPGGPKAAPTLNFTFVNNANLNTLLEKQLAEFDRKARITIFRQIEEILSEDMVHASGVTGTLTYMVDPSVKNAQMPRDAYNGAVPWMKHWYFGKA